MRKEVITIGIVLMVVGTIFTFVTLGFGFVCSFPLIFIGFIILIIGAIMPKIKEDEVNQEQQEETNNEFVDLWGESCQMPMQDM